VSSLGSRTVRGPSLRACYLKGRFSIVAAAWNERGECSWLQDREKMRAGIAACALDCMSRATRAGYRTLKLTYVASVVALLRDPQLDASVERTALPRAARKYSAHYSARRYAL
jgi:hypothetical protein